MGSRVSYLACAIVLVGLLTGCGTARRILGGQTQRGPSVVGTIQTINGSTITVQPASGDAVATVQITDSTAIRKDVAQTIDAVKPGMSVLAIGQQNGNTFEARLIQLRTQAPPRNGGNGQGGNGARGGQNGTSFVGGTVDSVSGNTIAVKTSEGSSVQVQLASNGRVVEQTSGSTSDLKQGEYVVATGQKQGDILVASSLNLSDSPPTLAQNPS